MNQLCFTPLSNTARLQLYADDILLHKPIADGCDIIDLKSDVDSICNWVTQSSLLLNTAKARLLEISRLHAHQPSVHLSILGRPIPESPTVKVTISSDLTWATHIDHICQKAKRQAGLIYNFIKPVLLVRPNCTNHLCYQL